MIVSWKVGIILMTKIYDPSIHVGTSLQQNMVVSYGEWESLYPENSVTQFCKNYTKAMQE